MNIEDFKQFVADHTIEMSRIEQERMALMGLGGEVGELTDMMKKVYFYNKELDREHLVEEIGDVLHYVMSFLNATGVSVDEIIDSNVKKISTRYHTKVSREEALERADKK